MLLKPIKYKKAYEDLIADKISVWMWVNIFQECFSILKNDVVANDTSVLRDAIVRGVLRYENGAFYSNTRFGSKIAQELETIGAKFSKSRKAYVIPKEQLPSQLIWAIDMVKAKTYAKVTALKGFLDFQLSKVNEITAKMVFDEMVKSIMLDLQRRVYENATAHKIQLITPKIDDRLAAEIGQKYTENMQFWIKNWTEQQIVKMRSVVGQMAADGKSIKLIEDYFIKEFGSSQRKARFLARNETALASSSYLVAKYEAEGFTHFRWHTNIDGRERQLHHDLNGKVFAFNDPPVIDERTGAKGLPSQTYNCRCSFSPIVNEEFLKNRRRLYKAQNSILNKVKEFMHLA